VAGPDARGPTRPWLIAANWKLHHTAETGAALARGVVDEVLPWLGERGGAEAVRVVLCPPFTALHAVAAALAGSPLDLGAQDVFWEDWGAYTGEVSAPMLVAAGCRYVIVGHSERRHLLGETDEAVARKARAAAGHGLVPIVCVGETLAQREAGRTEQVVLGQLAPVAESLVAGGGPPLVAIAYEPVWAIGTGRPARGADAQAVAAAIRDRLVAAWGDAGASVPVLYGGSVKPENAAEFLRQPDIDGALVGGASLDPAAFAGVVRAVDDTEGEA